MAPLAEANAGFSSIKLLEVILLPLERDATESTAEGSSPPKFCFKLCYVEPV